MISVQSLESTAVSRVILNIERGTINAAQKPRN